MSDESVESDESVDEEFRMQVGFAVFTLILFVCGMEMVPGWGIFHLNWPPSRFHAIMAVSGALIGAGASISSYRFAGLAGGMLAGYGALFAVGKVLERLPVINSLILVLAAMVGVIPGVLLYAILRYPLQKLREAREAEEGVKPAELENQPSIQT